MDLTTEGTSPSGARPPMPAKWPPAVPSAMDPVDEELLTGMGNCFAACGEGFEGTVRMVAHARGRRPDEVTERLRRLREESGADPTFRRLRARLPEEFPF